VRRLFALLLTFALLKSVAAAVPDSGWPAYGGDQGGTRYSPLAKITPANVSQLRVAWIFRTGELGQGMKDWRRSAFEATPILYDGTLYLTTSSTDVVAVNAIDGTLRWRHDSQSRKDLHFSDGVSRGVSLWVDEGANRRRYVTRASMPRHWTPGCWRWMPPPARIARTLASAAR
jgi:quinoprotein glucose dehydrogenase